MRVITFLLLALGAVAFAKAPLTNRDAKDSRANNYIVVLKKYIDVGSINEHFSLMRAASGRLAGAHRGLVRTYNINTFNAYHIECGEDMLEEIRNNEIVSLNMSATIAERALRSRLNTFHRTVK